MPMETRKKNSQETGYKRVRRVCNTEDDGDDSDNSLERDDNGRVVIAPAYTKCVIKDLGIASVTPEAIRSLPYSLEKLTFMSDCDITEKEVETMEDVLPGMLDLVEIVFDGCNISPPTLLLRIYKILMSCHSLKRLGMHMLTGLDAKDICPYMIALDELESLDLSDNENLFMSLNNKITYICPPTISSLYLDGCSDGDHKELEYLFDLFPKSLCEIYVRRCNTKVVDAAKNIAQYRSGLKVICS